MLFKNTIRKIKKSFGRYLSLIVIVFIGIAIFSSLQLCSPKIRDVQQHYYEDTNLMDYKINGTLGLTDNDIESLKQLEHVDQVVGSYSKEVFDGTDVVKVHAIEDEMNGFELIDGRMPTKDEECLADANHYQVGDTIEISEPNEEDDLEVKTFTVVGTIYSPLYTGTNYGSSQIGNGKLYSYLFVPKEVFRYEAYTEIYLTMEKDQEDIVYSNSYQEKSNEMLDEIESIQTAQEDQRYEELTAPIQEQLEQLTLANQMMPNPTYQENIDTLNDALSEIGESTWIISDRYDVVSGYKILEMQYDEVQIIANTIPFFFLIVVLLMTSNTIMRMITEERSEMGAMTSIGISNRKIVNHYVIYILSSTAFGTILGYLFGSFLLTPLFYSCFPVSMPAMPYEFQIPLFLILLAGFSILMLLVTIYSCMKVFRIAPADLLRPPAPRSGKTILLERIPILWKHLSFSWKITIRNIFRYKKRVIMTLIGTAGCTFLIMIGFGIQDSIDGVGEKQYEDVVTYDNMIVLNQNMEEITDDMEEALATKVKDPILVSQTIYQVHTTSDDMDAYVLVPNDTDQTFYQYFTLRSDTDGKRKKLDDHQVFVTTQIANRCGIQVGDDITLEDDLGNTYQVQVGEIIENYVSNYIYMSKELYEKTFDKTWSGNMIFSLNQDDVNEEEIANTLLDRSEVLSVQFSSNLLEDVNSGISGLNYVIFVLIIIASLLAFSVLYNLTSINISERIREISTLKVLGYTDRETKRYIYRETMIMVVFGIILGLLITPATHHYIINLLQNDETLLLDRIEPTSYLYATLITFFFALIMQGVTYIKLKKIDMIEALKSVD